MAATRGSIGASRLTATPQGLGADVFAVIHEQPTAVDASAPLFFVDIALCSCFDIRKELPGKGGHVMGRLIWPGCVSNGIGLPDYYWRGGFVVVIVCLYGHRMARRLLQALDLNLPRWT